MPFSIFCAGPVMMGMGPALKSDMFPSVGQYQRELIFHLRVAIH